MDVSNQYCFMVIAGDEDLTPVSICTWITDAVIEVLLTISNGANNPKKTASNQNMYLCTTGVLK